MAKLNIPVSIDVDELTETIARDMSYDAMVKMFKGVDSMVADWALTKKLYAYFRAEMAQLAEEEGTKMDMPEPWLDAEVFRLWHNSPELQKDVQSLAAFHRVAHAIEKAHGIRAN